MAAVLPRSREGDRWGGRTLTFELPVLRVGLSQRNAFAQSAAVGGSVLSLGKAAEIAQIEVARVTDALLRMIGRPR